MNLQVSRCASSVPTVASDVHPLLTLLHLLVDGKNDYGHDVVIFVYCSYVSTYGPHYIPLTAIIAISAAKLSHSL